MRINAGTAKGRVIHLPSRVEIRPTSDKVKQALFNFLGPLVPGARVLDLMCGSGNLGLEALSRGAAYVCFADKEKECVQAAGEAAEKIGLPPGNFSLLHSDAYSALKSLRTQENRFDLALLDPPYDSLLGINLLQCPDLIDILAAKSTTRVVLEHENKSASPLPAGALTLLRKYSYGRTALSSYGLKL